MKLMKNLWKTNGVYLHNYSHINCVNWPKRPRAETTGRNDPGRSDPEPKQHRAEMTRYVSLPTKCGLLEHIGNGHSACVIYLSNDGGEKLNNVKTCFGFVAKGLVF